MSAAILQRSTISGAAPEESVADNTCGLRSLTWNASRLEPGRHSHDGLPCPIILLHGLGDTADVWRPSLAMLTTDNPVLAFDLPGHGKSRRLEIGNYTVAALADHVTKAVLARGVPRAVLVGHSLGGRVCLELARRGAIHPLGVILLDMGLHTSSQVAEAVLDRIERVSRGAETMDELIGVIAHSPLTDRDTIDDVVRAMAMKHGNHYRVELDPAIRQLIELRRNPQDTLQTLAALSCPVAILRGAFSGVLNKNDAALMHRTAHGAQAILRTIEMAGHAVPLEQPGRLADVLNDVLTAWRLDVAGAAISMPAA